ncbi:glycosyl hydrolase family 18 protein [Listeria sp. PSOL-1]|uniref:glycosyl hydrolase family 18 protein n=1 Tax=Listeria sp. PSOL-1 TaxID=1844999 RepID=UPI0018D97E09|nr:glycosyl hydrolase family 18 protein [Listeria sp. PSOL-1]
MNQKKKGLSKYLNITLTVGMLSMTAINGVSPIVAAAKENTTSNQVVNIETKKQENAKTTVPYRNVMYYGDWSVWGGQGNYYPKDIPADLYTHLNFAFLDFDSNGNLQLTDKDAAFGNPVGSGNTWGDALSGAIPALAAIKEQHPNMKLGISIGGWSKSGDFSEVAANPTKRAKFVENIMKFVKYTGMDFVDIDWEYPTSVRQGDTVDNKNDEGTPNARPEDRDNYIKLMQDIRDGLDKLGTKEDKTYELSTALPGTKTQLEASVDVAKLFNIIDFGNMMTYDMNGAWGEKSGHQTALYTNPNDPTGFSIEAAVDYLKSKNVQMDKVVIGAAMYTRGWDSVEKGNDPAHPGLFQNAALTAKDADNSPTRGAINEAPVKSGDGGRRGGVWSYRKIDELKAKDPSLKEYWDDIAKAPYLYSETTKQFFTFDNEESVTEKANFVKKNHLGGVISWMASQDKDSDNNGSREELSNDIKKGLYGEAAIPNTVEANKSDLDLGLDVSVTTTDNGKKGFSFTMNNNETKSSEGEALALAKAYYSTIKKGKLIITLKDGSTLSKGDYKAGNVTAKDGKTYVEFSSTYDGKAIEPGASYELKLASDKESSVNENNIEKVELEQYYDVNTKLASQVLYGDDSHVNNEPVLSGVQDKTIYINDSFDPLAGVTAADKEDGDLTSKIKVDGSVNTKEAGVYTLVYTVSDSEGATTKATRKITVNKVSALVISGIKDTEISMGDTFDKLAGITAKDGKGKDITSKIKVSGTVDTNVAGTYTLTYSVTDDYNQTSEAKRQITVSPVAAPVISGVKDTTISMGDTFDKLAGVTAKDGKGKDITSKIKVSGTVDTNVAGTYTLTYSVTDDYNQTSEAKRQITVSPIAAPVISGAKDVTINVGDDFNPLTGVTAKDGKGQDITSKINVSGKVDTKVAGAYKLTYSVTDSYNQTAKAERTVTVRDEAKADFGVGQGIEWPNQVVAPFVDDAAWMNDANYSNNGAPNIQKLSSESGVKFFNLGFIQSSGGTKDGKLNWGWAGLSALSEEGDTDQYKGIKKGIKELRDSGGDVTISFGGLNSGAFWTATQDTDVLYNTYKEIVDGYGLTRIDFDVEGGAMDYKQNQANAKAVKELQEKTGVKVTLTLPVMPSGLTVAGENVVKAYLEAGVELTNVNIMAMCYGESVPDYAQGSIEAIDNTKDQVKTAFKQYAKQTLSDSEAYGKVGVTPSIGFESSNHPYFSTEMMNKVVQHAKDKGLGMVAFWSMNRDAQIDGGQGKVENRYEFTDVAKQFTSEDNNDTDKPQQPQNLSVSNITQTSADVTWTESASKVGIAKYIVELSGAGQTKTFETSDLSYALTGLTANKTYTVKVIAEDRNGQKSEAAMTTFTTLAEDNDGTPAWNADTTYFGGEVVQYNGKKYTAKWWTQGDRPDQGGAYGPWAEMFDPADMEWNAERIYVGGEEVTYHGAKYRAKWWTLGNEPGASDVWEKL